MRSFAQNNEDVVIARMFAHVENGHYVEAGAGHPVTKSVSFASYRKGWDGILVEPQAGLCDLIRRARPRDVVVEAALGARASGTAQFYSGENWARSTLVPELAAAFDGLSTERTVRVTAINDVLERAPWSTSDFHYLVLDVEGLEAEVLASLDLTRFRPWLMIVEAIHPNTGHDTSAEWEPMIVKSGYELVLFDGVSKFYLAEEHSELKARCYPACSTDRYTADFLPLWAAHPVPDVDVNALRRFAVSLQAVLGADPLAASRWKEEQIISASRNAGLTPDAIEMVAMTLHRLASAARFRTMLATGDAIESYGSV